MLIKPIISDLSVIVNHYDRDTSVRRRPGRYPGQYPSRTSQRPSTPIVYTLLTKVWKNIAPFSVNRFQFRDRLGSQVWVPLANFDQRLRVRMPIGRGPSATHARCKLALIQKLIFILRKETIKNDSRYFCHNHIYHYQI